MRRLSLSSTYFYTRVHPLLWRCGARLQPHHDAEPRRDACVDAVAVEFARMAHSLSISALPCTLTCLMRNVAAIGACARGRFRVFFVGSFASTPITRPHARRGALR